MALALASPRLPVAGAQRAALRGSPVQVGRMTKATKRCRQPMDGPVGTAAAPAAASAAFVSRYQQRILF